MPELLSLTVEPATVQLLTFGAVQQLSVFGNFSDGSRQTLTADPQTTYVSSDLAIATVTRTGLVTAVAQGAATISISHRGLGATAGVAVSIPQGPLVSLTVLPTALSFSDPATSAQLLVVGTYADGSQRDLTAAAAGTKYTSSQLLTATVTENGRVVPLTTGAATITATNSGIVGTGMAGVVFCRPVSPQLDPYPAQTTQSTVQVTGSAPNGSQVEIIGSNVPIVVSADGGHFAAEVPLRLNARNELFLTTLASCGAQVVRSSTIAAVITHDATPPQVYIDFPPNAAALALGATDVSGRVSDLLSGFMGLNVSVNGVQAQVHEGIGTNGTFFASGVPLNAGGPTTLVATARDAFGNEATTQITVTQVAIPSTAPRMQIISGNAQQASIGTALPQPLVVRMTHSDGTPYVGKLVTFAVTRSDGRLSDGSGAGGKLVFQTTTNSDGVAQAIWKLGSDAGNGNNRIEVTSRDIAGSVFFCASATPGNPAQINIGSGNSQHGETGSPARMPLRIWASDGGNGISNLPITFTVRRGDGKVNGNDTATVATDSTGHAQVQFVFGPEPGGNEIEANFAGNPTGSATFVLFGQRRDASVPTTFSGLVVDNSAQPLGGAGLTLQINGIPVGSDVSAIDGSFHITLSQPDLAGEAELFLDATTITSEGGLPVPANWRFPSLHFVTTVTPNVDNSMPMPIMLPPLIAANDRTFVGGQTTDLELTCQGVEGLKLIVRAGTTVTLHDGTQIGPGHPGQVVLSLNQVHRDNVPMPMPDGASPLFAGTFQPGGTAFDPPVEFEFPNMSALPAGSIMNFLSFDHATNRFEIVASGQVSADGAVIKSDPGVGIAVSGWHGTAPPFNSTGSASGPGNGPSPDNPPPPQDAPDCSSGGGGTPDQEQCPTNKNNPDNQCGNGPTDPVDLFSGEFVWNEEDLRIPGRGFDFVWKRTYRSRTRLFDTAGGQSLPQALRSSDFGVNWDHSYNITLQVVSGGLALHDGTGRIDVYKPAIGGGFAIPGFFRQLAANPDGTFTLTHPDERQVNFAPPGVDLVSRVSSILDRNGNTMTFEYDAQNRLSAVVDTLGHRIVIEHDGEGFITSITDHNQRRVNYAYGNSAQLSYSLFHPLGIGGADNRFLHVEKDLVAATKPAVTGTPTGNDFPNGKTTRYEYAPFSLNEQSNHNIVAIRNGRGQRFIANDYSVPAVVRDTYSCASGSCANEFNNILRNYLVGDDQVLLHHWGDANDIVAINYGATVPVASNSMAVRRTTVNDRIGNVTEYFYDQLNRLVIRREFAGRATPGQAVSIEEGTNVPSNPLRSDDPPFFETRWEYNDDSRVTRLIHPNGNITRYVYEKDLNPNGPRIAEGNVREIHHLPGTHTPVGDQNEIVELFEYDAGMGSCCGFNFVSRYVDGRGNETHYEYDMKGNRTRCIHAIPSIIETWNYNEFGQMTEHVLPDNGSGHHRHDAYVYYDGGPQKGYLKQEIVDAGGLNITTTYEYDAVGNVVRKIDPRGNDTLYTVNPLNQVVREQSPLVNGVRYGKDTYYDANNNVVRVDVQNVDENGALQPNALFTTIYEYEILNHVTRVAQEKGNYTGPIPGPVDQPTSVGLPVSEFVTTEYGYDRNRNRTLVRYGEATNGHQPENVVQTLYDERNLPFRVIRAPGSAIQSTTQSDYDRNRNRKAVREGLESDPRVTTYDYDAYNRSVSMTDAMGNVTTWNYDATGNQIAMRIDGELIDVDGGAGNVRLSEESSLFDPMNRRTTHNTAFFNIATQAVIGDGLRTELTAYSDASNVVSRTDDNGHATTFAYDGANRLRIATDAKNNATSLAYDADSNVVSRAEVDKSDLGTPDETFLTTYAYDNRNRLIQTVDNIGNTHHYQYDSRNNRTRHVDARGNVVRITFDGLNRELSKIRLMTNTGEGGGTVIGNITTVQDWDDSSRLIGQTDDNGNMFTTVYDGLNRKIGELYADGTLHSVGYDVHNNQINRIDANGTIVSATFDRGNRLIRRNVDRAPGVLGTTFEIFKYDGLSRLVYAQNDDSLVTRVHDSLSHILSETQALDGYPNAVVSSTWDAEGNQRTLMYPGGRLVTQTFDELNRKKSISDQAGLIALYNFNGRSRVQHRDYGNNTRSTWSYDGIRRITGTGHFKDPTGANLPVDVRAYVRDAMNSKTSQADALTGESHAYGYDSVNRLTRSIRTGGGQPDETISYNLDGVGNRTSVVGGSDAGAYILDPGLPEPGDSQTNQYTATPFDARQYDANGNLIAIDSAPAAPPPLKTLSYDFHNMMVALTDVAGGPNATYVYDALGRRITKLVTASGSPLTTRFILDGWREIEEQDATGRTAVSFVFGQHIDEVLNMRRGSEDFYYHTDDLYDVAAITGGSGAIAERYAYDDFGGLSFHDPSGAHIPKSAVTNALLFQSRRFDAETGSYYYRTRNSDPSIGRFLTRDLAGTWYDVAANGNAYAFLASNPTSRTDAYGYGIGCHLVCEGGLFFAEVCAVGGVVGEVSCLVIEFVVCTFVCDFCERPEAPPPPPPPDPDRLRQCRRMQEQMPINFGPPGSPCPY